MIVITALNGEIGRQVIDNVLDSGEPIRVAPRGEQLGGGGDDAFPSRFGGNGLIGIQSFNDNRMPLPLKIRR